MAGERLDLGKIFKELLSSLDEARFKVGDHEIVIKKPDTTGLAQGGIMCSNCKEPLAPGDAFCRLCGMRRTGI